MNSKRIIASVLLAFGLTAGSVAAAGSPAFADTGKGASLTRGQALFPGEYIERHVSGGNTGGVVRLSMQTDGNLVLWEHDGAGSTLQVCWSRGGFAGYKAIYQQDGNFVLYPRNGGALWASNTVGTKGSTVDMNSKGQLWVGVTPITGNCAL
jgi:hypothetical protein